MNVTTSGGAGLAALRARLEQVSSGTFKSAAREAVRAEVTALVEAEDVPVRTGALLASRVVTVSDEGVTIAYTSEHASFVNEGTSRMAARRILPPVEELGARARGAYAKAVRAALGGGP